MDYNATIEVLSRATDPDATDAVLDALDGFSPAIAWSGPRGWMEVTITVPADTLRQAITMSTALVEQATGKQALAVEVMQTSEYDERQMFFPEIVDLIDTNEAARLLGVTRQRVAQLASVGQLPSVKVGNSLAFAREAVEHRAGAEQESERLYVLALQQQEPDAPDRDGAAKRAEDEAIARAKEQLRRLSEAGPAERQVAILEVIRNALTHYGRPPSMREISHATGDTPIATLATDLAELERLGYLHRVSGTGGLGKSAAVPSGRTRAQQARG
jgi:excisionase family DNA binding protein